MSIEQAVVEKLRVLSLDKQQEVLDFVEFLESKSHGHLPPNNRWEGMTALEAARKYAGVIEGSEDFSTNSQYMEGFGNRVLDLWNKE
ncbi:MAG: DUF2281 domain-containing protein [Phormidesmis sp. CAN_BIN44]|nr:DUF2281 domain-containing protein [Phormidesmis sp. CAN_BIN44]